MQVNEVSKTVGPEGQHTIFFSGIGRQDPTEGGPLQKHFESQTVHYERPLLGLEMVRYPTKNDVLNRINFKLHPELRTLHQYYKSIDKNRKNILVNVLNDIRDVHSA